MNESERFDAWGAIVGIPIEQWIEAKTVEQLAALIEQRDTVGFPVPVPRQGPCPRCNALAVHDETGAVVTWLCLCPDPGIVTTALVW